MEANPAVVTLRFNKFLPYWAVLQTDLRQTFRSWVYRLWVLMSVLAAGGFLLYRVGLQQEAGIFQSAAAQCGELFRVMVVGSLALVVVLAVSAISSEKGTVADSVLSRGISRHQYFLAKWHARLFLVLTTYFAMCAVALLGGLFLLHSETLTLSGSLVAMLTVGAVLTAVISCGVSVSAVSSNTIVSIAVVWLTLYGTGFALSLLPENYPSPDRALQKLPDILKGFYDTQAITRVVVASLSVSVAAAVVGMFFFSRRDV